MARTVETVIIGGIVKIRPAGTGLPFRDAGLVSTCTQATETQEITLQNTRTPEGGNFDKKTRITAVTLAMNFREFNTENIAANLWANVNDVPSAAVTEEEHLAQVGKTIVLDKMPLTITEVVDAETGLVTFDEDDDFRITGSGIEVLEGSALATAIGSAEDYGLKVSYTCAAFDEIEALTNSSAEFEIILEGQNGAGTQLRINPRFWRCKFAPAESLDWLGTDDFMGMTVAVEVLADDTRGVGKSAYMKIQKEKSSV
ncbi:hypothetical protein AX279_19735 [Pseudomonas sp. J237]|nr:MULTISPECIES: hypothetical protein [Pseudomonas]OEO24064.1 hypothetical protein AX279_19735 [Pseudomonas sp. J237]